MLKFNMEAENNWGQLLKSMIIISIMKQSSWGSVRAHNKKIFRLILILDSFWDKWKSVNLNKSNWNLKLSWMKWCWRREEEEEPDEDAVPLLYFTEWDVKPRASAERPHLPSASTTRRRYRCRGMQRVSSLWSLRVARSVNNKINTTSISFSFCLSVLRNSSAASRPLRLCSVFTLSFSRPRWSGSTGFASVCCDLVSFSGLSFDFTCCVAAGEHCLFCCRWHGYLIQVEELLLHFWKIPILSSHLVFIWLPCKTGN